MKPDKGPRFSIEKTKESITIHDSRTGAVGQLFQEGQTYRVELIKTPDAVAGKTHQLQLRMADWYFHTQVGHW